MGDTEHDKWYSEAKKKARKFYQTVGKKETRSVQETFHKIMGTTEGDTDGKSSDGDIE